MADIVFHQAIGIPDEATIVVSQDGRLFSDIQLTADALHYGYHTIVEPLSAAMGVSDEYLAGVHSTILGMFDQIDVYRAELARHETETLEAALDLPDAEQ